MNNGFQWWLVIVGICLGAGLLWLVLGRLPRQDDDVGPRERVAEAMWISQTIEVGGGIAPLALVEEILELHASYLDGPPLLVEDATPVGAADPVRGTAALVGPPASVGATASVETQGSTDTLTPAEDVASTVVDLPPAAGRAAPPAQGGRGSVGDRPPVQRYDARREAPETDVRQPG
jgi:hypothetical protein